MYLSLFFGSIFVANIVFSQFLGICPYIGVSKRFSTALGMGAAVTFVMFLASTTTFIIYHGVLVPLGIEYLITIVFILVIAALVQLVETAMKKLSPPLYSALGIYLPLITTNCAILGVAILCIQKDFSFMQMMVYALGNALGFTLAIVLFSAIREKLELANVPKALKGVPIAFIVAGLLSMAFMGFSGLS
ncbi:MAG: RnfABCDGE type electron transport complex subunit A [Oligoflexia bacterium]|nr:RnfABCDGE type electron transport complex subunit A [Oligoflexia bacterium]